MTHQEVQYLDRRADIARKSRKRVLAEKDRRVMMAMFGIMAYMGSMNLILGALSLFGDAPVGIDGVLMCVFGTLFAYAAMRVWAKDDTRWWIVVVPAGSFLVIDALLLLAGYLPNPVPTLLSIVLVILLALRRKTLAALRSVEKAEHEAAQREVGVQT
jgi:hypothetical protein